MLHVIHRSLFAVSTLSVLMSGCLMAADQQDVNNTKNADVVPPAKAAPNPAAPVGDDANPTTPVGAVLAKQDADFIRDISSACIFEIKSSQWALDHGLSGNAASFARTVVADHQKMARQLDALLTGKGVTAPDGMCRDHEAQLEKLAKTPEDQLGKAYMDGQVAGHEKAIRCLEDEASKGKDADLRAFAAAGTDTAKQELAQAQAVQ